MRKALVSETPDPENIGRRDRILRELRHQITVQGISGITMRDLALASGVATKTLYNLFGSKDALVSESVRESYRIVTGSITETNGGINGFERLVSYVVASAKFNLSEPIYTRAMIYAYYSADSSLVSFHRDFHDYLGGAIRGFLVEMQQSGDLNDWSSPRILSRQISEAIISTAAEWTREVLSDKELVNASLLAVLSQMLAHLSVPLGAEARSRIRALSEKLDGGVKVPRKKPGIS